MKTLVCALTLLICACNPEVKVKDSEHVATVSGNTTSTLVIDYAFIERIQNICRDKYGDDTVAVATCTLENIHIFKFGDLPDTDAGTIDDVCASMTPEQKLAVSPLCD